MEDKNSHSLWKKVFLTIVIVVLMMSNICLLIRIDNKNQENKNLEKNLNMINNKLQKIEISLNSYKNYFDSKKVESEWQCFVITGYSANDSNQGTLNKTATTFNLDLNRVNNLPIIAVDLEIIPLYSIVEIENLGAFIALDTGGAIKGNRIDILFNSKQEAINFGIQELKVRIINEGI